MNERDNSETTENLHTTDGVVESGGLDAENESAQAPSSDPKSGEASACAEAPTPKAGQPPSDEDDGLNLSLRSKIIGWVAGGSLLVLALNVLVSGAFIAPIFFLIAALFVLPPVREATWKDSKQKLGSRQLFFAVTTLTLIGVFLSPSAEDNELDERVDGISNERTEVPRQVRSAIKTYEKNKTKKLSELIEKTPKDARELAIGFAASSEVASEHFESFYRCLGDFVHSKSGDLELDTVMGWCLQNFQRDPEAFVKEQSLYSYFDVRQQFSMWDGSHPKSVEAIKSRLNDPSSFKHDETRFRIEKRSGTARLIVLTQFRGTNAFGGVVRGIAKTVVDPNTGEVLEVEID